MNSETAQTTLPQKNLYTKQNLFLLRQLCSPSVPFVSKRIYMRLASLIWSNFLAQLSHESKILFHGISLGYAFQAYFMVPYQIHTAVNLLLCFGLLLFAASSIACTLVTSVEQLILWRFIQGLGCGAITGIASTMVFDVFPSKQSAQLITILNSFVTGMMAAAPMLGSWINLRFGLQMNFIVVAIGAVLSLAATFFLVTESHPAANRRPFSLMQTLKDYQSLFTNVTYVGNTLIWTTMFGMLIVFTSNLSLIYIDHLQRDPGIFGYYQASVMTSFFIASLVASRFIAKFGTRTTILIGNTCFIIGAVALALFAQASTPSPLALTAAMALSSAGVAIGGVIYFVESLADFTEAKGASTALSQSIRLIVGAGMIALASVAFNGTVKPIAIMGLTTGGDPILTTLMVQRRQRKPANQKISHGMPL